MNVSFIKKQNTSYSLLDDPAKINNVLIISMCEFQQFIKHLISDIKKLKKGFYVSLLSHLYSIYKDNTNSSPYKTLLSKVCTATNVVVTDLPNNVFLKKLKTNKFTDNINYLIIPNFVLWDHNFVIFLNKTFNSKTECTLIDVSTAIQSIKFTHGVIKDQIQSKYGYAGQFVYSSFLDSGSFYANVLCVNNGNTVTPPLSSLSRHFGRKVGNIKVWNTRHPNISQISTQVSKVLIPNNSCNWNIKIGLGTFVGANRDCDGDKEVVTYMPYPNSVIDFESVLYAEPGNNFICFDKLRLNFVPQQIFYLYIKRKNILAWLRTMPPIDKLWLNNKNLNFHERMCTLLTDICLLFGSKLAEFAYYYLIGLINECNLNFNQDEIFSYTGKVDNIIKSGAKGNSQLIKSTKTYINTDANNIFDIAQKAREGLNNHISSHSKVKVGGGDIYHNNTVLQNVSILNNRIIFKNPELYIGHLCLLPSAFLFDEKHIDFILQGHL